MFFDENRRHWGFHLTPQLHQLVAKILPVLNSLSNSLSRLPQQFGEELPSLAKQFFSGLRFHEKPIGRPSVFPYSTVITRKLFEGFHLFRVLHRSHTLWFLSLTLPTSLPFRKAKKHTIQYTYIDYHRFILKSPLLTMLPCVVLASSQSKLLHRGWCMNSEVQTGW